MFREMHRAKQAISREECIRLLKTEPRAVLSVIGDDGYPYGSPTNLPFELRRKAGDCSRVTAGPIDLI